MSEAKSNNSKQLLHMAIAYSASGGSLLFAAATQLVTFAILARALGPEQFSLYVTISAITTIAVTVCGLGGQDSLVRRVARNPASCPVMLGHVLVLLAVSGTFLVVLGLLTLPALLPLAEDPLRNVVGYALVLGANLVLYRYIVVAGQCFVALSDFKTANLLEVWYAVVRLVSAVLACLAFGVQSVAEWAVWLFYSHSLVALTAAVLLRPLGAPKFGIVREEVSLGLLYCSQFVVRTLRQNVDLLVIGVVATPETIGSYGIARRMLDSSYISIEAINRLVYPGSAAASAAGLHNIRDRIQGVLYAAVAVGTLAAFAMFLAAPLLPLIFGQQYSVVLDFARILCWAVIPFAAYAVALDALGASGRQGSRSFVLNSVNGVGAVVIGLATWMAGVNGTFAAFYFTEFAMVVLAWIALTAQMRRDRTIAPSNVGVA